MSVWAKRTDENQQDIVDGLRKIGCSVKDMSKVGGGFPDLIVGFRGVNYLLEVKHGKGKLNDKQELFHAGWYGQTSVVRTVEEAISAVHGNG